MSRPTVILITVCAMLLVAITATAAAKKPTRTLTGITVDSSERSVDVKLSIDGNNGQPLGKVYYTGDLIKIVVQDTGLSDTNTIKVKADDSLVSRVEAKQGPGHVILYVRLTKKVASIMEHIVFTPGVNGSTITLRKAAFYELPAPEESPATTQAAAADAAVPTQAAPTPAAPTPTAGADPLLAVLNETPPPAEKTTETDKAAAGELPPLVPPSELAQPAAPLPTGDPAMPVEEVARREQALTQILDPQQNAPAQAAQPDTAAANPEAANPEQGINGVGTAMPDLTNLYVMAGVILLVAALWFGIMRGRHVRLGGHDEPLRVVKSQNLGNKQRLVVVEAEGKRLLLSATDKDVRLLTELDASSDDRAITKAMQSEKVRYLFNDKAAESAGAPVARPETGSHRTRTGRPAFFGSADSGSPFSQGNSQAGASQEAGLKEKLRNLRKKG